MQTPTRVLVIKPLTICQFQLEVGDEFDVTEWNETDFGTFFRPMDVPHMPRGTGWLFTEKTFEVIEWDEPEDNFDESMDGDFDSAMASAGFGTDEDYGFFGDDETYGADF